MPLLQNKLYRLVIQRTMTADNHQFCVGVLVTEPVERSYEPLMTLLRRKTANSYKLKTFIINKVRNTTWRPRPEKGVLLNLNRQKGPFPNP